VDHAVVVEQVQPRPLAAVRGLARPGERLGPLIIERLNIVWLVLRAQGVTTRQNVVMYFGGSPCGSPLASKRQTASSQPTPWKV
jgi:hypothetical protein